MCYCDSDKYLHLVVKQCALNGGILFKWSRTHHSLFCILFVRVSKAKQFVKNVKLEIVNICVH